MADKTLQEYIEQESSRIGSASSAGKLREYLRTHYHLGGQSKQLNRTVRAVQQLLQEGYSAEQIEDALIRSGATQRKAPGGKIDTYILNAARNENVLNEAQNLMHSPSDWMKEAYDTSEYDRQYKEDVIGQINKNQVELEATINNAELDSYRQLYYKQQELENTIAENRLKAIKSGTTSAQLASQQLSNIFAGYNASNEIANNAMQQRLQAQQGYNETSANAYATLYNNKATMGAQNAAALSSYYGYIDQKSNDYYLAALANRTSNGKTSLQDYITASKTGS